MPKSRSRGIHPDIGGRIDTVLVEPEVAGDVRTRRLLERMGGEPRPVLSATDGLLIWSRRAGIPPIHGKRTLRLARLRGDFFKKCPASPGQVCCGYRVLNVIHNCPFDCDYCILQTYLEGDQIMVYMNIEDAVDEVRRKVGEHPGKIFRVGTGELGDSLAVEPLVPLAGHLITSLAGIDNVYLELKTKSANVNGLIGLDHGGRVIVSWSLAPDRIVRGYEPGTSPVAHRLEAARRVQDDGYLLGFHFDPIIRYDGWEEDYAMLIDSLFGTVDHERVAWISLGCLRYTPALREAVLGRADRSSKIFLDEFVPCPDGKMRYIRPVREEIYGKMRDYLRERAPAAEIYLCMESRLMWENVFDFTPMGENWLSDRLDRAVSRFSERSSASRSERWDRHRG